MARPDPRKLKDEAAEAVSKGKWKKALEQYLALEKLEPQLQNLQGLNSKLETEVKRLTVAQAERRIWEPGSKTGISALKGPALRTPNS